MIENFKFAVMIAIFSASEANRTACPEGTAYWTGWFDYDNPTGEGDYELLADIRKLEPDTICDNVLHIEAQTLDGVSYQLTGQTVYVDPQVGLQCANQDQRDRQCKDYRTRYCCQKIQQPVCSKETAYWTKWFDYDNPTGDGDFELLVDIRKMEPDQICDNVLHIEAQTLNGVSHQSTGQIVLIDPQVGFHCVNDRQTDGRCQDYRTRYCCPKAIEPTCDPDTAYWTQWFDRDNPSGNGDYEMLIHLRKEYPGKLCENILQIEAKTLNGVSYQSTGEILIVNTQDGLACTNKQQPDGRCLDYQVRFCCPKVMEPTCDSDIAYWTQWFDRDNPGGYGDYETLNEIRKENPGKICDKVLSVEARTTSGESYQAAGETVVINTQSGFYCVNSQQPDGVCKDYEARFCCPKDVKPVCDPDVAYWTKWFDRDDPSGYGDYETLSDLRKEQPNEICDEVLHVEAQTLNGQPYHLTGEPVTINTINGFFCENALQPDGRCQDYKARFCCPKVLEPVCNSDIAEWTQWFDRDNPGGNGDYETLPDLRKQYPGLICEKVLHVEARTTSGVDYQAAGEVVVIDNQNGFYCVNAQQPDKFCQDYETRFCCPKVMKPACPSDTAYWTPWFDRDNPSGKGDYETLSDLRKEYPGRICNTVIHVEARTLNGVPHQSAGENVVINNQNGFYCVNSLQPDGKCEDYETRFCCEKDVELKCPSDTAYWTQWFDRDDPTGEGDHETLSDLRKEHPGKICENVLNIDARTLNGAPYQSTGEVVMVNIQDGLTCDNDQQPEDCLCQDYKVRFCCPKMGVDSAVCPCETSYWTEWFNRDHPSGEGDFETLTDLRDENPGKICDEVLHVEAETLNGIPYQSTGEIVVVSNEGGFYCVNDQQPDRVCQNYRARFCCPKAINGTSVDEEEPDS